MVDAAGATTRKGSGVASDEGEGAVFVSDGKILGSDSCDTMDVGEVVNLEVADFSGRKFVSAFGVENLVTAPGWEAVGSA